MLHLLRQLLFAQVHYDLFRHRNGLHRLGITQTEYRTNRAISKDLYGRCAALIAANGAKCDGIAPFELGMEALRRRFY